MRMSLRCKQITAVGTLAVLAAAVVAVPATAAPADPVRQALAVLTVGDGVPGAEAVVREDGRTRTVRSGVGDLAAGTPMPSRARFRAGSITKSFVATVVLQLVAEGRVRLDAPIATYLPGVVTGNGNDGTKITVRQLLQHTSGLPNYTDYLLQGNVDALRHRGAEPAELVAMALAHPPLFAPGTSWSYSNTNYVLAQMLVERVTGQSLAHEISARISRPLGLTGTSLPGRGDETLPAPHPRGYVDLPGTDGPVDFTDFDPSIATGAGNLVSTGADLDTFFTALLGGRLLPPAQLAEMKRTVPVPGGTQGYGLGLILQPLPGGGRFWGHDGEIFGFYARAGVTDSGRSATVVINEAPGPDAATGHVDAALETALTQR